MIWRKKFGKRKANVAAPVRKYKHFSALKGDDVRPSTKMHFMLKLMHVIIKNYKMIIRSRTSALIFFFGPLLIIFLVCMGFNTSTLHGINVAAHSESYSQLSESLLQNLSDDIYNVEKVGSEQECIDSIRFNGNHVCVVFPKDMALDNSANNNIQIYADDSRINIADTLVEKLASKVSTQSKEISSGVVSQLLGSMDNINKEVEVGKSSITRLKESNKVEQGSAQSILNLIGEIDFGYSAIDTGAVLDELEDVRDAQNMSSGDISDLKSMVESLTAEYTRLSTNLATAKDKATSIQEEGQNIKTALLAAPAKIGEVENSFTNIKNSIDSVKIRNVESIVSPLRTSVKPVTKNRSYLVYVLPPLLMLLVMFSSLLMSSTSIIREKQSSAYFRNFITPTNDGIFILGQYLTDISLITAQITIMLGVTAMFIPGIPLKIYLLSGVTLLILATIFIFAGMTLGYLFSTGESVTVAAMSAALLLLLFSNTVLPLETLSGFLRTIVEYNPFVVGEGILKRLLVFESVYVKQIYILLIFVFAATVAAVAAHKIKEHLLAK